MLVLSTFVAMPNALLAQGNGSYAVNAITVDSDQADVSLARSKAVKKAVKLGFEQLLQNITPVETHVQHIALREQVNYDKILDKFSIVKEVTHPKYLLTVDLFYNRKSVRDLLEKNHIPYSDAGSSKVVVLPLIHLNNKRVLWEENNPWREAMSEAVISSLGPVRFMLPAGGMDEITSVTPEMVAFGAGDVLANLASNYNAENVAVTKAWVSGRVGQVRHVKVDINWYGTAGFSPTSVDMPLYPGEKLSDILYQVATETLRTMQNQWRNESLVELDRPGRMFLRFNPTGPSDLEKLKSLVGNLSIVKLIKLRVLNTQASLFQVDYFGAPEKLQQALIDRGISVVPQGSVWSVQLPQEEVIYEQ